MFIICLCVPVPCRYFSLEDKHSEYKGHGLHDRPGSGSEYWPEPITEETRKNMPFDESVLTDEDEDPFCKSDGWQELKPTVAEENLQSGLKMKINRSISVKSAGKKPILSTAHGIASNTIGGQCHEDMGEWIEEDTATAHEGGAALAHEVLKVMRNADNTTVAVYETGQTSPVTEYAVSKNKEGDGIFITDSGITVSTALAFGPQFSSALQQTVVYSDGSAYFLTDPETGTAVASVKQCQLHGCVPASAKVPIITTKEGKRAFHVAGGTVAPLTVFDVPDDMNEDDCVVFSTGDGTYTLFNTESAEVVSRVVYNGMHKRRTAMKYQKDRLKAKPSKGVVKAVDSSADEALSSDGDNMEVAGFEVVSDLTSFATLCVAPKAEKKQAHAVDVVANAPEEDAYMMLCDVQSEKMPVVRTASVMSVKKVNGTGTGVRLHR